jgi:hypothetical protein
MCEPITMMAMATAASAGATVHSTKQAKKTANRQAAAARKASEETKNAADAEAAKSSTAALSARNEEYASRRGAMATSNKFKGNGGLFSSRSFFAA